MDDIDSDFGDDVAEFPATVPNTSLAAPSTLFLINPGLHPAQPEKYSLRAFLNGRI